MCSRVLEPFHLWYYCTLPGYDASVSVCNATAAWRAPLLLFTCIVARCGLTRFPSAQSRVRCPYVFLCGIRYSQYLCHAHPAHSILPPLPLHQYCQHRADLPSIPHRTPTTPPFALQDLMYASPATHLAAMQPAYQHLPCYGWDAGFGGKIPTPYSRGGVPATSNPAYCASPWGAC